MDTICICISLIFAFIIPTEFTKVIENIKNEKPYTFPTIIVSIGFVFILATLFLFR